MIKKNKLILLFTIILLFSFNIDFVEAATCTKKESPYAMRDSYYSDYGTYHKYMCVNGSKMDGYCADKGSKAPIDNNAMKKDKSFSTSTACVYGEHKNLDCSSMVGYIIKVGKQKAKKDGWSNTVKYGRIQRTIQTFLWYSGENAFRSNNVDSYKNFKYVKTILKDAYKEYAEAKSMGNIPSADDSKLKISFKIDDVSPGSTNYDNGMYYDNKNYYYSYKVKAIVECEGTCGGTMPSNISIVPRSENTQICRNGVTDCYESVELALSGNGSIRNSNDFYVRTTQKNLTTIDVFANYITKSISSSVVVYDSVMYKRKKNPTNVQKLIVYEKKTKNEGYGGEENEYSNSLTLYPKVVEKRTSCTDAFGGYTELNSGRNSQTGKICSSNVKNINDATRAVAEYKNCTNSTVNVSFYAKNPTGTSCVSTTASVNVALADYGYFKYGNVIGDDNPVRRGSGFYLQEPDNPTNTISSGTYFINKVSWTYNVLFSDNKALYFYLSPTASVHHDSNVYNNSSCSGRSLGTVDDYVKSQMNIAIKEKFKFKDNNEYSQYLSNLNNIFVTVNDNDANDARRVPAIVSSVTDFDFSSGFAPNTTKSFYYSFKTPYAYFRNSDFGVNYTIKDNDPKFISVDYTYAGRRYYTYNKYVGNTFPLNISNVDSLSLINGMNWILGANCDIDLDDGGVYKCEIIEGKKTCYINYRYRSISVSNPFPKATGKDDLPDNWKDWWWGNANNQNRLKNTFNNKIFYRILLNNQSINKINSDYGKSYTTWDNIKNSGISSFVEKYNSGGNGVSNTNSYCKLGQVPDSSCDRW